MIRRTHIMVLLLLSLKTGALAYTIVEGVATTAGGYDIPIKICIPEVSAGKMPVMFFVHGGGWNGGDDTQVPGASIPADAEFLCDEMGIIYVGLAYRCKGNNATFHDALQDLENSIGWFEERADRFNADMSRIGFSGGSAGTTLSAILAHRYDNCKVYIGREGMYNILDLDTTKSNFPNAESRADFGLVTFQQKLEASPFYQVRNQPAESLLLHGKDDWLCHYSQSVKYADHLKNYGGNCKLVLYEGINHTCLNIAYPEVFTNSMMEIARLYARGYGIENVDFESIRAKLEEKVSPLYPYEKIPDHKLPGAWHSSRFGTLTLNEDGQGVFVTAKGTDATNVTYRNNGSWFSVKVDGEEYERSFYLRQNDQVIYELITENNRYKSRRNDFRKISIR